MSVSVYHSSFLQAVEIDVEAVQCTALRVIFDLIHVFGLSSFETPPEKKATSGSTSSECTDTEEVWWEWAEPAKWVVWYACIEKPR